MGGVIGGQMFFFPPQNCHYVRLCVPYKPWKFGDDCGASFLVGPLENMGLLYKPYMYKLLILLAQQTNKLQVQDFWY